MWVEWTALATQRIQDHRTGQDRETQLQMSGPVISNGFKQLLNKEHTSKALMFKTDISKYNIYPRNLPVWTVWFKFKRNYGVIPASQPPIQVYFIILNYPFNIAPWYVHDTFLQITYFWKENWILIWKNWLEEMIFWLKWRVHFKNKEEARWEAVL